MTTVALPDDLMAALSVAAVAEGRSPADMVRIAVERLLMQRRLQDLASFGHAQAERLGLVEDDIDRLIAESRRESDPSSDR